MTPSQEAAEEAARRPQYGEVVSGFKYGCWQCEDGEQHDPHRWMVAP